MPYRRSDLTRLLKDIINSKNLIICTIHSGSPYFYDSVDTLNYIYGLINKVKSRPEFFEKKLMPLSPKALPKINKKYLPSSPKKYVADRKAITPKTVAILPVHVYGNPCDTDFIEELAIKNNLHVIYDAAHCFGVKKNGVSILKKGDLPKAIPGTTATFASSNKY